MKNNIKITLTLWALLLFGPFAHAQAGDAGSDSTIMSHIYENLPLYVGFLVVAVAIFSLLYLVNSLMQIQKMRLLQEHGIEAVEKMDLVQSTPLWRRIYDRWTAAVPIEKEDDVLMDHDYDGIRELDNRLPPWWVAVFYITIAFGVVYLFVYHLSDYGVGSREAYEIEMEEAEKAVAEYLSRQADNVDETNVTMLEDANEIALGKTIFESNCVACHGQLGEGAAVGPNLTDEHWIHGGGITNIFSTVKYGVPEKGMIAWKTQLRPVDIHRVSSYIWTLQGTNPPNAKEAEGEVWIPEPVASDPEAETEGEPLGMNNEE